MINELIFGKSSQCITKYEEKKCKEVAVPQNITVILPAYDEEVSIGSIVLLTSMYADNVIVVDDGSSDRTADVARRAGAEVVLHEANKGKGAALKTGFAAASDLGADIIVTMDSDGQHNPAENSKLFEPLKNGFDFVIGSRFVNGNGKNVLAYRKVGMKVLDVATSFAGGLNVTDSQSGFRAYGRKAIENINLSDSDMSAGSEILIQAKDHKLKYTEVEIHCRYDLENISSQNPFLHGPKVLLRLLKDMEYKRPLYYFTAPGMFMSAIGLSLGLKLLYDFYYGGSFSFGPTFLTALLIIVGMLMVFTEIILHAVSRMISELKKYSY